MAMTAIPGFVEFRIMGSIGEGNGQSQMNLP